MNNQEIYKLPAIGLLFWIMKICATTLGETAGDLFSMTMKIGYAQSSVILLIFFGILLSVQLASKKYNPILYWLVILATSTAGTTISDFMDRSLGLGYAKGSLLIISVLIIILIFWKLSLGTISVDKIKSRKAEVFYWAAILTSNTLGTALGDYLADDSGLGFMGGIILIGGVIAFICLLYYFTNISRVLLFWAAFILTRPFGANLGDVLTKSHEKGGLGFGTIGSSLVLGSILIVLILYANKRQKNV